ncbi:MAG: putative lipoprotein [Rickettsiaceae bacterium]|jgi:hypothetical protein|nr:putative lipoprotein [Rickettsiaceae bacterium]
MKKIKLLPILATLVLAQGCGTVFSGTSQTINIKAVDAKDNSLLESCKCSVMDGSGGTYIVPANPGSVIVSRANGPVQVTCKKDGYRQLNTAVGDSFNATTLVNVLFWPGFIVDAMSGAYKKFPSHYVVAMERK